MFAKISNLLISGFILTAIIFASLGCNTDLETQAKQASNLTELSQFETTVQNTSCNCLY